MNTEHWNIHRIHYLLMSLCFKIELDVNEKKKEHGVITKRQGKVDR